MSQLIKAITPLLCAAALLSACSSTGWGQKSSGSTHGLTGGAEAAPTSEATPQPARPRGEMQRESGGGAQGGSQGGIQGESQGTGSPAGQMGPSSGSSSGDATTGGAEGAQTKP